MWIWIGIGIWLVCGILAYKAEMNATGWREWAIPESILGPVGLFFVFANEGKNCFKRRKKMKLLALVVLAILLSGCALVKTKDILYVRIGWQEIASFEARTDPNGVSCFYFSKQKAKIELDPLKIGGIL